MSGELVTLANKIEGLHKELGTWERVGEYFGLPKIVPWRIVHDGYEPRNNETRRKLGITEIIERKIRRDSKGRFAKDIG